MASGFQGKSIGAEGEIERVLHEINHWNLNGKMISLGRMGSVFAWTPTESWPCSTRGSPHYTGRAIGNGKQEGCSLVRRERKGSSYQPRGRELCILIINLSSHAYQPSRFTCQSGGLASGSLNPITARCATDPLFSVYVKLSVKKPFQREQE